MSKKNTNKAPIFTPEFAGAVRRVLDKKCKDGDTVNRKQITHALLRGEGGERFGITNREMLKLLVMLVVQESECEGTHSAKALDEIEATRGKFGGYYNRRQRDEWNAAVEKAA